MDTSKNIAAEKNWWKDKIELNFLIEQKKYYMRIWFVEQVTSVVGKTNRICDISWDANKLFFHLKHTFFKT